jgi:hypothetical protein
MKRYINFKNDLNKNSIIYYDDVIKDFENNIKLYGIQKFNFKHSNSYIISTIEQHDNDDFEIFQIDNVKNTILSYIWNGSHYKENDLEDHLLIMPFFLFETTDNRRASLTPFAFQINDNDILIFNPEWQDYIGTGHDKILPLVDYNDVKKLYDILIIDTNKNNIFYKQLHSCFIPKVCDFFNIKYPTELNRECNKIKMKNKFNL